MCKKVYVYVLVCVYVCLYVYVCVCVWVWVCLGVCVWVCLRIFLSIYKTAVYVFIYTQCVPMYIYI
jgi:hypothetical protein